MLVDRRTGKVVCAFDEVSDSVDIDYRRKRAKLDNQNTSKGAQIKYGLSLDTNDSNRVKIGLQSNVPVFVLALSPKVLHRAFEEVTPDGRVNEVETRLFGYFKSSLKQEAQAIFHDTESEISSRMISAVSEFLKSLDSIK